MKKLMILSLSLIFGLPNVALANNNLPESLDIPNHRIKVNLRPQILGLWGMDIPQDRQCIEYYNFKSNNQLLIYSRTERSQAIYDYQLQPDDQTLLPMLLLQVKYDNNQLDCSGQQIDQSGEISQYFVKWINANTIDFCSNEQGDTCFATLRRILP